MVWDRNDKLAVHYENIYYDENTGHTIDTESETSKDSINIELSVGGRIAGQFVNPDGGSLPSGKYGTVHQLSDTIYGTFMSVNLETGQFTSPVLSPEQHRIVYGDLEGKYLSNNGVLDVEVAPDQTKNVGTFTLLLPSTLKGTITDPAGRGLGGIEVSGKLAGCCTNNPHSPFGTGSTRFNITTSEDGYYEAYNLLTSSIVASDKWEITLKDPSSTYSSQLLSLKSIYGANCGIDTADNIKCWGDTYTNIPEGQFIFIARSCGISTDKSIECWGYSYGSQNDPPEGQFTAITAGGDYRIHYCGIDTDEAVQCWGNNENGQTDAPDGQFTFIAAGSSHACAIRIDGTIECWGNNENGQTDAPDGQFAFIAANDRGDFSCAISTDDTIQCWGNNDYGQTEAPEGQFTSMTVGSGHVCAIRVDDTIECWGRNNSGQAIAPSGQFTSIAIGSSSSNTNYGIDHTCAIRVDGTIECWGRGQATAPSGQFTSISARERASCAIRADGVGVCWPESIEVPIVNNLSIPSGETVTLNHQMASLSDDADYDNEPEVRIAARKLANGRIEFALQSRQADDSWGDRLYPQRRYFPADSTPGRWLTSTALELNNRTVRIAARKLANGRIEFALQPRQADDSWGDRLYPQRRYFPADSTPGRWLTSTALTLQSTPTRPSTSFTSVAVKYEHACGIHSDGTAECWGNNDNGQGNAPEGQFTAITVGTRHSCGIRTGGTIACWGDNDDGKTDAPEGQFTTITAGYNYTCGIRTSGTIACWGDDYYGQTDAPEGQFTTITANVYHTCGIRTGGTIVCWGDDDYGQTDAPEGQFTSINYSCGIRTDDTIECWGGGYLTYTPEGKFTAINSTSWYACGVRTDGSISCWNRSRGEEVYAPEGKFVTITNGSCGIRTDGIIKCWSDYDDKKYAPEGKFTFITYGYRSYCAIRSDGSIECWGDITGRIVP